MDGQTGQRGLPPAAPREWDDHNHGPKVARLEVCEKLWTLSDALSSMAWSPSRPIPPTAGPGRWWVGVGREPGITVADWVSSGLWVVGWGPQAEPKTGV